MSQNRKMKRDKLRAEGRALERASSNFKPRMKARVMAMAASTKPIPPGAPVLAGAKPSVMPTTPAMMEDVLRTMDPSPSLFEPRQLTRGDLDAFRQTVEEFATRRPA